MVRIHLCLLLVGFCFSLFAAAAVFKGDPLDPLRGQRYREKILQFGGSREELDSLKVQHFVNQSSVNYTHYVLLQDFLGREPDTEAFLKELFGADAASKASL